MVTMTKEFKLKRPCTRLIKKLVVQKLNLVFGVIPLYHIVLMVMLPCLHTGVLHHNQNHVSLAKKGSAVLISILTRRVLVVFLCVLTLTLLLAMLFAIQNFNRAFP